MSRKHDINDINLNVSGFDPIKDGLRIYWDSNIGFGQYDIWVEDDKIYGESECMDSQNDKGFIRKLLELVVDQMTIY